MQEIELLRLALALLAGICLGVATGLFFGRIIERNEKALPKPNHLPKCGCNDIDHCETYCDLKFKYGTRNFKNRDLQP